MNMQIPHKTSLIKCPHCGAEYLPGERYLPESFIGHPVDIVRDTMGRLLYEDYLPKREPELTEHFICEYCDKQFIIEATVTYKTREEAPEKDFSNKYVSLLD